MAKNSKFIENDKKLKKFIKNGKKFKFNRKWQN